MLENRTLEILIIALVVVLLFGAKRLPGAARSLGKSLRILKAETAALRTDPGRDNSGSEPPPDSVQPALFEVVEPIRPVGVSDPTGPAPRQ
jgi:sec-independent protein translocase protein TatA